MIMDKHFETLANYVFDHDKLVTYKWLSKELQVHVNIAKQILWKFYEKYHENSNIECTYLLIGTLKNNGIHMEVVRESDLSKMKEKFNKIISEHLYSVHKPLKNLEQLARSDPGDVTYNAIKCDACIERNDEEMHLLRWGITSRKVTEENQIDEKTSNHSKTDNKLTKKNNINSLFQMSNMQKSLKTSDIKMEKHKFTEENMDFLKNTDSIVENKIPAKENNIVENNKDLSKTVIMIEDNKDFTKKNIDSTESRKLSANNYESKRVSSKKEETKKVNKGNLGSFFEKISHTKSAEIKMPEKKDDKAKAESSEKKESKKQIKPYKKKRNRSHENDNIAKKRKRIMIQSDSSDSETQIDMEIEEMKTETEAPVRSKTPPPKIIHESGKRKVLKLVNKTYKEGDYMVTKKEHIYVSCSDEEEETEKPPMKTLMAKVEKTKKKQTTLTNFFKRT